MVVFCSNIRFTNDNQSEGGLTEMATPLDLRALRFRVVVVGQWWAHFCEASYLHLTLGIPTTKPRMWITMCFEHSLRVWIFEQKYTNEKWRDERGFTSFLLCKLTFLANTPGETPEAPTTHFGRGSPVASHLAPAAGSNSFMTSLSQLWSSCNQ